MMSRITHNTHPHAKTPLLWLFTLPLPCFYPTEVVPTFLFRVLLLSRCSAPCRNTDVFPEFSLSRQSPHTGI
jgi:hypothetical protein